SAEPDQILYAPSLSTVNDSAADQQWGAELIDVEAAWSATTGAGVTVAVLDTAFLPEHPDLAGRMQQGYDFVDHDTDVSATATLEIQHGTHVAGIVGAARNNGMFTSGVAPGSTLMPLRVLGDCLCGSLGGIIQGLRYAAGLPNDSGTVPVQKAKVANLSLQLPYGRNAALLQTLEDVTAAGMTVVWAAGNESDRHSYDEAGVTGVPGVVVVNAVGSFQKLSGFSNFGSAVDISAPGGDTEANNGGRMITSLDGRYMKNSWMYDTGRLQGTSQAAPFVAGVIALMASVWDDMTPAAVDAMIERGDLTRDLGLAGNDDYYGAGIVDAGRAVQAALAHVGRDVAEVNPKRIVAMPGEAAFGAAQDVIEIDLFSTDDSAPTLSMIYAPAWVTVSQSQTDRGYGIWTLRVNRDALTQENHEDVIQFSNGERQLVVPVSAHNPENSARSTGVEQVLVQFFDSQSGELVHEEYALAQANYSFEFASDDVPVGRYTIQASSDFDEDENYCEVGELCGQFGNNGETEVTVVAGQGLVFEVLLQLQ
ncbi:MAG: S8 family serine peptidase, partial [Gammaproteobacteria bacterium]|nr:S8 family serine peptidase [Gammaproteobacteria bacterium]